MLGAIAGDMIGSYYEAFPTKTTVFPLFNEHSRFTDDTVLTVAVADWLLHGGDLVDKFHEYFDLFPQAGYGGSFVRWAGYRQREPYNSWGNGSAMRVSPVAYAFETLNEVLDAAKRSAEVTHNHPEGIRGAQAVAAAVFLARQGQSKDEIRDYIEIEFGYSLRRKLAEIWHTYAFDVSCQGSVPESIISFLEADDFESAVRNAISLGGDADTMACIAGAIGEAQAGGIPEAIQTRVFELLDPRLAAVVETFRQRYSV